MIATPNLCGSHGIGFASSPFPPTQRELSVPTLSAMSRSDLALTSSRSNQGYCWNSIRVNPDLVAVMRDKHLSNGTYGSGFLALIAKRVNTRTLGDQKVRHPAEALRSASKSYHSMRNFTVRQNQFPNWHNSCHRFGSRGTSDMRRLIHFSSNCHSSWFGSLDSARALRATFS